MNYIYDVMTNFQDKYYDFFEWDKLDKLIHFKKIPIIKVDKKDFITIYINKIKINTETIKKIKNKSEIWNKNENNNKYHYILITNGNDIIGLEFDNEGINTRRSSLYIDEELDIIKTIKRMEKQKLNFSILKKLKLILITRKELTNKEYLKKQLNNLSINKDVEKINYLYYECFNKEEKNIKSARQELIKSIDKQQTFQTLYNFFNLIQTSNK